MGEVVEFKSGDTFPDWLSLPLRHASAFACDYIRRPASTSVLTLALFAPGVANPTCHLVMHFRADGERWSF